MTFERPQTPSERERLARLRNAWQADQPSDAEVERARIRWLSRAHSPARGRPGALLVAAVMFGAAGAVAASGTVTWPSTDRPVAQRTMVAPPATQPRSAPARLVTPRTAARVSDAPKPPEPSKRAPLAPSDPDSGSAPKSGPPPVARSRVPSDAPTSPSATIPLSAEPSGAWQRAADALRQGDDRRATDALQELSSSSDPYTRDSAALAKAQLDAAAGRWELALPVLRQLAATGSTPLLRRRAGEVLAQGPRPE